MCKKKMMILFVMPLLLSACSVGPQQLGLSHTSWDNLSDEQQQQLKADYLYIKAANAKMPLVAKGSPVKVTISNGFAKFPPDYKRSRYEPATFSMQPGSCQQVGLRAASPSNALTLLKVCYSDEVLFFDPSTFNRDKQQASIYIQYQPLWVRGMSYKGISSEGFVGLQNVNIHVQKVKTS